jgi:hypothetical protein
LTRAASVLKIGAIEANPPDRPLRDDAVDETSGRPDVRGQCRAFSARSKPIVRDAVRS